jgi:4-diphosphocytidyl-2-C-methyl-D-erythritol kinase
MRIPSFAKINLGLEVLRKRENGYHEIRTLFQSVNLYDTLEFSEIRSENVLLSGDSPSIPWDRSNLVFRAAELLRGEYDQSRGIRIRVTKRVPAGRGLGGGSSNAAMTLYALNKMWGLCLDKRDLMALGRELGADIPYFLEGGLCLGWGRGDETMALPDLKTLFCVLVFPAISISTASIYRRVQTSLTSKLKESKIIKFLEKREFGLLENSLEETVFTLHPQLKVIKSLFQSQGAELSLVSGTGSAVFGLFFEVEKARKAVKELRKSHTVLLVETLPREGYWRMLKAGV